MKDAVETSVCPRVSPAFENLDFILMLLREIKF